MRAFVGGNMWIRQVAMVAAELQQVEPKLSEFLGVNEHYTDAGVGEFGLTNCVLASGNSFVEIVAPTQPDTAAGRTLNRQGGDCGYMVLFQLKELEPLSQRVDQLGFRKIWQTERPEVTAFHVHPKDMGGAIVSFDEMRPEDEWVWAGPDWQNRRAKRSGDLRSCTLEVSDPLATAMTWAEVLCISIDQDEAGPLLRMEDGCAVRFQASLEGAPRGLVAFTLAHLGLDSESGPRNLRVCGVDITLV